MKLAQPQQFISVNVPWSNHGDIIGCEWNDVMHANIKYVEKEFPMYTFTVLIKTYKNGKYPDCLPLWFGTVSCRSRPIDRPASSFNWCATVATEVDIGHAEKAATLPTVHLKREMWWWWQHRWLGMVWVGTEDLIGQLFVLTTNQSSDMAALRLMIGCSDEAEQN